MIPQYSKARILGTWAAAALPMGLLAWVVAPCWPMSSTVPRPSPGRSSCALTVGLFWQFVLVLVLVRREQGTLRWSVLREALWLRSPESPKDGRRGGRLWWVLVPMVLIFAAEEFLPVFPHPGSHDFGVFLESHAGHSLLTHSIFWPLLIVVEMILNTVLGEELLFRGLLLPRMRGAFGRGDWAVNGILFAAYHLHQPWSMPGALYDTFALAYPASRYRSAVLSIIVHSTQTVFFVVVAAVLILS